MLKKLGFTKLALTALAKRELAKKLGLIFEGTGRKWALRGLRKGKSFEELGAVSEKHLRAAKPMIEKQTPKGVEVSFDVYKTKRTPIQKGSVGFVAAGISSISPKIKKTFHTHPYKALFDQKPEKALEKILKSVSAMLGDGKMTKVELREMMDVFKETGHLTQFKKELKIGKALKPHLKAHPAPPGVTPSAVSDLNFMQAIPKAHHNILEPSEKILGIHKIRPKGIRSIYKKI